ncbi:pseudouridine synthase, partial [Piscinibacter sp.]|uniref:pseudouridine synthase n=1 Tax=Piscinibacter sp. TaxID=1903157 RepID=UPI003783213D
MLRITVDEGSEGQRLDNFLIRLLKGVPKTHVYRVIRSGEVRVNKGRAAADTRLEIGDVVRVPPVRVAERSQDAPAPAREFPVLHEDAQLLAIDKPAGVAVHGGSGVSFGVIEQLRRARPQARFLELVHRLDKETSGVLLLAGAAAAQVCHTPIVHHAPIVHQAAAVEVVKVVKELIAVPVLIPAYGAVYTPPVVPATATPAAQPAVTPADLKAIADSLRA